MKYQLRSTTINYANIFQLRYRDFNYAEKFINVLIVNDMCKRSCRSWCSYPNGCHA